MKLRLVKYLRGFPRFYKTILKIIAALTVINCIYGFLNLYYLLCITKIDTQLEIWQLIGTFIAIETTLAVIFGFSIYYFSKNKFRSLMAGIFLPVLLIGFVYGIMSPQHLTQFLIILLFLVIAITKFLNIYLDYEGLEGG